MPLARQLHLQVVEEAADQAAEDELAQLLREVVHALSPKEVAYRVGAQVSGISHALAGRDGRQVPARWLAVLARHDPERRIARYFAELAGCDLVPRDRRTAEQRLEALRREVELAGSVGADMLRRAGL